jgi:hypothetical protein
VKRQDTGIRTRPEQRLTTSASQALLEIGQLLEQFGTSSQGRVRRLLQFLNARGFKLQFDLLEQELRDCLVQLSAILSVSQFTSQVRLITALSSDSRIVLEYVCIEHCQV